MDKAEILKKIVEIADELERVAKSIYDLEATLQAERKLQCQCQVEYTGGHTFPCKGVRK